MLQPRDTNRQSVLLIACIAKNRRTLEGQHPPSPQSLRGFARSIEMWFVVQLVERFGVLDLALLEAAILKHHKPEDSMDFVQEAMEQCSSIVDEDSKRSESIAGSVPAADDRGRRTISTVAWKSCPSVSGNAGQHRKLMSYVEALVDAESVHYIIPGDLLEELDLQDPRV
jgi:hypothetical protein